MEFMKCLFLEDDHTEMLAYLRSVSQPNEMFPTMSRTPRTDMRRAACWWLTPALRAYGTRYTKGRLQPPARNRKDTARPRKSGCSRKEYSVVEKETRLLGGDGSGFSPGTVRGRRMTSDSLGGLMESSASGEETSPTRRKTVQIHI